MTKFIRLLLLLILLYSTVWLGSGCGQRTIESRTSNKAVIVGLGLEKQDDMFVAHAQNIRYSQAEGKKGYDYELLQIKAPNYYELFEKLFNLNQKMTLWKHLQTLIIHETIPYEDIVKISDFLERNTDIPLSITVVYSAENISDIFNVTSGTIIIPAMSISNFIQEEKPTQSFIPMRFFELVRTIQESYRDVHLPILTIEEKAIQIEGMMVLLTDGRKIPLSAKESKAMMRIRKKMYGIEQTLLALGKSSQDKSFIASVEKSNLDVITKLVDDNPEIHLSLKETFNLEALSPQDSLTMKDVEEITNKYRENLYSSLENTIARIQEIPADILDFAQFIERQHPSYWKKNQKQWKTIYPKLNIHIEVEAKMNQSGLSKSIQ